MGIAKIFTGLTGAAIIGGTAAFYLMQPSVQQATALESTVLGPATQESAADKAERIAAPAQPLIAEQPAETAIAALPVQPEIAPQIAVAPQHRDPLERLAPYMQDETFPASIRSVYRTATGNDTPARKAEAVRVLGEVFTTCELNQELGVDLYRLAAAMGSTRARIDLAVMQHDGKYGITADRNAALEAMRGIDDAAARKYVASWSGHASLRPRPRPAHL